MKQALKFAEEIDSKIKAVNNTKSWYLVNDLSKSISKDIKELKDYCKFKGISFEEIVKTLNAKGGKL